MSFDYFKSFLTSSDSVPLSSFTLSQPQVPEARKSLGCDPAFGSQSSKFDTGQDGNSETKAAPPPTSTTTLIPNPILNTAKNPAQDQTKASLCPHEPERGLFGEVLQDNTAVALNFGDSGGSSQAIANQDIDVSQK